VFSQDTHGTSGKHTLSRRHFLRKAASLLGLFSVSGFVVHQFFTAKPKLHQNTSPSNDAPPELLTVYKMVPLRGREYMNAARHHMANKIFPSIEAARARRPHRGFFYGLKPVRLPSALVNNIDVRKLFNGRKDLDLRVVSDRLYCEKLGVEISSIFEIVKKT
jgi:hypothetical protein